MQTEAKNTNETPLFQSATDAAQAVRRKEVSSRELTEMLLARIEAVNPALNAIVELRPEAAPCGKRPPPTMRSPAATTPDRCTACP